MSTTPRKIIDAILFKCEACYPSQEFDPAAIDVWHEVLAGFSEEEVTHAFSVHVKNSRFLPTISEIIDIITKSRAPAISIESEAQAEWRKVLLAFRQRGLAKGPPAFKHPITRVLVQTQFNWQHLGEMKIDQENWVEKRWCEAFTRASEIPLDQLQIDFTEPLKQLVAPIGRIEDGKKGDTGQGDRR